MSLSASLKKKLGNARIRISVPFLPISYEANLTEFADVRTVDERIAQLGKVKKDLEAAISAVDELQLKAIESRSQYAQIESTLKKLEEEKATTEALLKIPEESFTRVFAKASSRGRWRGIIEGLIVGFVTGCASSYLVWYLTK